MEHDKLDEEMKILNKKIDALNASNKFLEYKIGLITELFISSKTQSLNFCPVCEEMSSFIPGGEPPREYAKCPHCGSYERDRLMYFLIKEKYYEIFENNIKLLHFAPEVIFYNYFNKKKNIDYFPVDLSPERYEAKGIKIRSKVNMENMPYENDTFDVIYNSHVLEHIFNDVAAMKECYRVLKPGGICFIMVPLSNKYKTFENENYNTPELRKKYYGLADHVRIYGHDIQEKLKICGFNVIEIKAKDIYKTELKRNFYGLLQKESIFICKK